MMNIWKKYLSSLIVNWQKIQFFVQSYKMNLSSKKRRRKNILLTNIGFSLSRITLHISCHWWNDHTLFRRSKQDARMKTSWMKIYICHHWHFYSKTGNTSTCFSRNFDYTNLDVLPMKYVEIWNFVVSKWVITWFASYEKERVLALKSSISLYWMYGEILY